MRKFTTYIRKGRKFRIVLDEAGTMLMYDDDDNIIVGGILSRIFLAITRKK